MSTQSGFWRTTNQGAQKNADKRDIEKAVQRGVEKALKEQKKR